MIDNLIYDIGMCHGEDTEYYLHCGFNVLAIEANPYLVDQAKIKFSKSIASGKLTILNVGISDTEGTIPFWIDNTSPQFGSFEKDIASRNRAPQMIEVTCQRLSSILKKYGTPSYIKIDIEGKDYVCLEDLPADDLPKYVSFETGGMDALRRLNKLGYSKFKCISQFGFIPVEINKSVEQQNLEKLQSFLVSRNIIIRILRKVGFRKWILNRILPPAKYNNWVFRSGSSGPFGEDTLGKWHTFTEMEEIYLSFLAQNEQGKSSSFWIDGLDYSFWTDFHAKL